MREWLEKELADAEEAWEGACADSGYASARAQYWAGYIDAINNALNELGGMN